MKEKRTHTGIAIATMTFHIGLLTILLAMIKSRGQGPFESGGIVLGMDIACIVFSLLISFSVLRSEEIKQEIWLFLMLLSWSTVYLFCDGVYYIIQNDPQHTHLNVAVNTMYLVSPMVMLVLFWRFLDSWVERGRFFPWGNRIVYGIAGLELALFLGNIHFGYFFSIAGETGVYTRGVLYPVALFLPTIMVLIIVGRIGLHRLSAVDTVNPIVPLAVSGLQVVADLPAILSPVTFCSVAFLYTNFYAKKELQIAHLRRDYMESELRTLQMQINPHFLYNTLASIAVLCNTKPQDAQEMIYRLSAYMRDNFTDVKKPNTISFQDEKKAVEHYIAIEQVRFPNIEVVWDVQPMEFLIPAMTLQPLVENAINHGIRKRPKSDGVITIVVRETEDAYTIRVMDDGVGLQESRASAGSGRHLGIENVRKRLSMLCDGDLKLIPLEKGTEARITIPKKIGGVLHRLNIISIGICQIFVIVHPYDTGDVVAL